ncbi:hypothetical protein [Noviherbaspirillum massiliense]|uniref:hypothetical protein n=1 Tax=Noviherbaspirillum massiliense TaxID=1465823 RepID=UPI0002E6E923|nr:hypothetical protein [Noviherbaspirillum massiliense]
MISASGRDMPAAAFFPAGLDAILVNAKVQPIFLRLATLDESRIWRVPAQGGIDQGSHG